jgi:hypothetical protein
LLFVINRVKKTFLSPEDKNTFELPPVALVVAAYNEYGSIGYSNHIVQQHDFITLLHH